MKGTPQSALCLVLLWISASNTSSAPSFFPETGSWYDAVIVQNTWSEAKAAAEGMSYLGIPGRLATITSQAENDFLLTSVLPVQEMGFWLGARRVYPYYMGIWEWTTGEPWTFSNWDIGEPNNASSPEDYLQIYSDWSGFPLPDRRLPGRWNDVNETADGYKSAGYVIEYAAVPEPSTFALACLGAAALMIAHRRR